jgi:isocitrate dehydrogenase
MTLSGQMMFDYLGWKDAAGLVRDAVEAAISSGQVTYDIERHLDDAERVGTDEFADAVVDNVRDLA